MSSGAWDIAFRLAQAGRKVFPLHHVNGAGCSCGRPDCHSPGKHPLTANGVHDASGDESTLTAWRARWPSANIGLATGAPSAVLVIDIDPRHGGDESLAQLEAEHGPLPETITIRTGSGGRHLYFQWPEGSPITIGAGIGGKPGLDWRGTGGYVVAPGSVHASGQTYEVLLNGAAGLAEAPEWLLALLRKKKHEDRPAQPRRLPPPVGGSPYGLGALRRETEILRGTERGKRNHQLNASAFSLGQLVAGGEIACGDVEAALFEASLATGLSEHETLVTIASGLTAGMELPRAAPPKPERPTPPEPPPLDDERPPDRLPAGFDEERSGDLDGLEPSLADPAPAAEQDPEAPEKWEPPTPISAGARPLFPVETLPGWLGTWVRAEAEATQTPPDLAALQGLSAISAAVARRFRIRTAGGHEEPLNIYTLAVLPSGSRKSRVSSDAGDPIEDYERTLVRRTRDEIEAKKLERKALEATAAKLEKDFTKAENDAARDRIKKEIQAVAGQLASTEVPAVPRLLADDTTPERLAQLLAEQGGRMAILSAEGGLFETLAGRYSKTGTSNIDIVLKAHSGENARIDRIGRPSIFVERASLVLGLAVQPDVLRGLARKEGFRGRGLCGRFLYSLPRSLLGERRPDSAPMPSEVHEIYKTRLIGLLDLRGTRDEYGKEQEHVLEMTTDARAVFRRFQEEIEPQLAEYGDLGHMTDWGGKLVGAVGRIAGLLHLAKTPTCYAPEKTPVALDTVEAAISIGRYLIAHAKLAYGDMGADEEVDDARYLLGFIRSRDLESFTASALHRSLRNGRFHSPEQLTLAIQKLEDHGLVRQIPQEKRPRGRNPSFAFAVSPFAHRKAPEEC